jgi:hypothetical protein
MFDFGCPQASGMPISPSISAFPSRSGGRAGAACVPSPACGGRVREGGEPDGSCNRFENALSIGHDVVIVEAQNTKAFVGKVDISTSVALLLS